MRGEWGDEEGLPDDERAKGGSEEKRRLKGDEIRGRGRDATEGEEGRTNHPSVEVLKIINSPEIVEDLRRDCGSEPDDGDFSVDCSRRSETRKEGRQLLHTFFSLGFVRTRLLRDSLKR